MQSSAGMKILSYLYLGLDYCVGWVKRKTVGIHTAIASEGATGWLRHLTELEYKPKDPVHPTERVLFRNWVISYFLKPHMSPSGPLSADLINPREDFKISQCLYQQSEPLETGRPSCIITNIRCINWHLWAKKPWQPWSFPFSVPRSVIRFILRD